MKRVHRKINDLLRQQLIVQEHRIKDCIGKWYRIYMSEDGTYFSDRFKTNN